jgi:hypothetical protein
MIRWSGATLRRTPLLAACTLVATAGSAHAVEPGTVLSHTKISDTAGGFGGVLDHEDYFGVSMTSLGDLDGDGVIDLAVGAFRDDDADPKETPFDQGAVWVLFLNNDGTVNEHQKISDTEGNFSGDLDDADRFGVSVTSLGDLDGDEVPDLAVGARWDDDGGDARGAVWMLFLNTDGTVKSHQKISDTAGGFPPGLLDNGDCFGESVAFLGDLDGDGVGDLAVGAYGDDDGGDNQGAVWVLFLNTDGTVKSHQKISDTEGGLPPGLLDDSDYFGESVASLGDLDGPGHSELALAVGASLDDDGGTDRGAVWMLFLNSDGTVWGQQKISSTDGSFAGVLQDGDYFGSSVAALGDQDGDGVGDLAVGTPLDDDGGTWHGAVWVLFLDTDGAVKGHQKISDAEGGFTGTLENDDEFGRSLAALGDLDGAGVGDLAAGAYLDDDGGSNHGAVWVLFLDGVPTIDFDPPQDFPAAGAANREATGDLDGDQFADVVIAVPDDDPQADGVIQVFLNQGLDQDVWQGLVANVPDPVGTQPSSVAVGSLNRSEDDFLDVVVTNAGNDSEPDTVTVLFNAGDGSFPTSIDITVGNRPSAVVTADFGLDTFPDLAVANEDDDNVWVLAGDGAGGFGPPLVIATGGSWVVALDPEDIDNDKDPDIAGVNRIFGKGPSGSVFVARNQGGVFDPAVNYAVGTNPVDLATGDLDRDGFADIAAVNFDDDTVSLLVNQGDGTYTLAGELAVGDEPLSVEIVDLDSDLDADLAVVATDPEIGPAVQVFRNIGQAVGELIFDGPEAFSVDADPNYVVGDDFNNDTLADLVTVNSVPAVRSAGSVTVLLNSPPTPACPWDVDDSGEVTSVTDFLDLLAAWGTDPGGPPDFDNDGTVGVLDFLTLLAHWGPCP